MDFFSNCYKESGQEFDKAVSPEETISRVLSRFSETGLRILQETVRIDKGRLGIPVYISKYTPEAIRITNNPKQMGKGGTPVQAEASAVMELVERYSLFSFLKERERKVAPWRELSGPAVSFRELALSLHDDSGLESNPRFQEILRSIPFEWVEGHALGVESPVLLPWSWFWPINEFNGSAAGNTVEEAAVQALCEIIERHVCSELSYKELKTPTIDPGSLKSPMAKELVGKFRAKGIELVLKDFTLGMGVPTVGAIAWDPSTFPRRSEIVYTAGTAPSPERAAIRAITEVAQLAGDFDTDGEYVESGLPKFSSLEEASYVLDSSETVSIDTLPDCGAQDFLDELRGIFDAIRSAGLTAYVVDVTHPVLRIPVVYAIVPGNHFRERTRGVDLLFHASKVAASLPDPAQAGSLLEQLHSFAPARFEPPFYLGHVMEREERFEEALAWFQEALEREPLEAELPNIYCHLGVCHKEMEDYDTALTFLERAKALNPGLKEVYNLMGYCHFKQKRYVEAIEAFEAAIELDPASAIDYANIGSNLRRLGMAEAAKKWYEMALELDPGITWAREHLEELEGAA